MNDIKNSILDNLSVVLGIVVAIIAAAAVAIPMMLWSNSVSVTDVNARVLSLGTPYSETYQCGSNKIGEVTVPIYCTRMVYPTTFTVSGTDETFSENLYSSATVGTDYAAYKVVDGDSYFYTLMSPQDVGFYVLIAVFALMAALIGGFIAYFITDHFTY